MLVTSGADGDVREIDDGKAGIGAAISRTVRPVADNSGEIRLRACCLRDDTVGNQLSDLFY
eukprot:scaffold493121_cov18-Prasinocladus_malaysianus.AAC.1